MSSLECESSTEKDFEDLKHSRRLKKKVLIKSSFEIGLTFVVLDF